MSLWYCSHCGELVPYSQLTGIIGQPTADEAVCDHCLELEERAMVQEQPTGIERAIVKEKSVSRERAAALNESKGTERADGLGTMLSSLVHIREDLQKIRIAESNRLSKKEQHVSEDLQVLHERIFGAIQGIEEEIDDEVRKVMIVHPTWPWLKQVRGVGPISSALVVAHIDIERAHSISALWRYAGYGLTDGKRDRPTPGQKLVYNKTLKTYVYRLITGCIRAGGNTDHPQQFDKIYRDAKHGYLTIRGPDSGVEEPWTLLHCELAARRKAAKLFLAMLWQVWREAEGLPLSEPYVAHAEGHDIIDPWEFVSQ